MKQKILNDIRQIPSMELDTEIDIDLLVKEVLAANNQWYPYVAPFMTPANLERLGIANDPSSKKIYDNYEHCSLITYNPWNDPAIVSEHFAWKDTNDITKIVHYYDLELKDRQWHYTSEASKYPYLMELVSKITSHPSLCKVIRSRPGNWLGWHSHQHDPVIKQYNKPEQCIIHIPVVQHEDVAFLVTEEMPTNRSSFETLDYYKNDSKSYVSSFLPGKAYFFNGYYPHSFKNYSEYDRIDIVLYSDTTENIILEELMEKSIAKYCGPRIGKKHV
jgi:hypothetical protein